MLGRRIRELRTAKVLYQEAFADQCGLDPTYVGGIERSERNVAVLNLARIADSLGVSISEWFEGI